MSNATIAFFSIGKGESENSDAFLHLGFPDGRWMLAIADGVGSAKFGGQAARLAVEVCRESGSALSIREIFAVVDDRIAEAAGDSHGQWSTTLSLCVFHNGQAHVGHVGDARIYHIRGAGLLTRTHDQTEVERLIEEGVLTRERAQRYPRKHVLLSSMNGGGDYQLEESTFGLQPGDRVLLASDGFYKKVLKREIVGWSIACEEVDEFVDTLKGMLMTRGVVDDATVLCAQIPVRA
ncbi:protein phosphatase 2C domain-containing protein [Rhodocyclus purpureus]|uniref:protein phosphatase 2C domain-containing protein n=1 Tax=Rhodocyclus purpureus TaxID=1067 RepID=UPI0019132CD1